MRHLRLAAVDERRAARSRWRVARRARSSRWPRTTSVSCRDSCVWSQVDDGGGQVAHVASDHVAEQEQLQDRHHEDEPQQQRIAPELQDSFHMIRLVRRHVHARSRLRFEQRRKPQPDDRVDGEPHDLDPQHIPARAAQEHAAGDLDHVARREQARNHLQARPGSSRAGTPVPESMKPGRNEMSSATRFADSIDGATAEMTSPIDSEHRMNRNIPTPSTTMSPRSGTWNTSSETAVIADGVDEAEQRPTAAPCPGSARTGEAGTAASARACRSRAPARG